MFSSLQIRLRDDPDGALRVTLFGEVDLGARDHLRTRLGQLEHVQRHVRLDLSHVGFIDCCGVDAILSAIADAGLVGCELEVDRTLSPSVELLVALPGVASGLWPGDRTTGRPSLATIP